MPRELTIHVQNLIEAVRQEQDRLRTERQARENLARSKLIMAMIEKSSRKRSEAEVGT
jgi:hypothetical protein